MKTDSLKGKYRCSYLQKNLRLSRVGLWSPCWVRRKACLYISSACEQRIWFSSALRTPSKFHRFKNAFWSGVVTLLSPLSC